MPISKWLPWALAATFPVLCLAVKRSFPGANPSSRSPEAVAPVVVAPAVVSRVYGTAGKDLRTVTYRMSKQGKPLTCEVLDESGSRLIKCRFGYRASMGPRRGELAEVRIMDARDATVATGEMAKPLRRIIVQGSDGHTVASQTVELAPEDAVEAILGPAMAGFNPVTDWRPAESR